ncbi:MAG: ISAzo13 family transposase [Rhodothermaceae bacterium]|nr:ISAzo13 family transposase [Rhodothermaceae bacterium]MYJ19557.1 ISAzo13 family transposase [Rhodothermaceae bacterium]
MEALIEQCRAEGIFVISVDTKKKELIGRFASPGTIWCKKPIKVNDHDFPSYARFKAVPYGIFDLLNNRGTVGVGDSSDTPEFAVDCIVHWFEHGGRHLYPHAKRLVILADCGGSNNYRARAWKYLLQTKLCDPYQLPITVAHYPSGASKWNPIEHRLFGPVTINISGRPLDTEETFMNYISTTTNQSGLCVTAVRVTKQYQKGMEITVEQMATINLTHNKINPKWNYDIQPRESLDSAELPTDP